MGGESKGEAGRTKVRRILSVLGPRSVGVVWFCGLLVLAGLVLAVLLGSLDWLLLGIVAVSVLLLLVVLFKIGSLGAGSWYAEDQVRHAMRNAREPGQPLDLLHRDLVRDVGAITALDRMLPESGLFPALGGWAATPETIATLVGYILRRRPSTIVECGSGASTVWLAGALKASGGGRLISLEHDPQYLAATRRWLEETGLADFVDLRLAELRELTLDEGVFLWYAPEAIAGIRDVDLLFVDGPPGSSAVRARYPAFPMQRTALASGGLVVLDDVDRAEEREIFELWREAAKSSGMLVDERRTDRAAFGVYATATP